MSENEESHERRIEKIDRELAELDAQIKKLQRRRAELRESRERLTDEENLKASARLATKDWENGPFEWSDRVESVARTKFGVASFRPRQLSAINVTLSGENAIVVMPTGAGKSLCYQLPALVDAAGVTIVVCPLISLMEDQLMALARRSVPAKMITAASDKKETTAALDDLTNPASELRLLYVTPERFAKSKRFMAKLQKCHALGRLRRIAIDEVHCCSQWGHDFRPDYKFLGVLSAMFPDVPILGLTATATTHVLIDVQKMLDIQGCLLIKSSFNRPNLFYQIISKPASSDACLDLIETLLKVRYKNQSGIIYAHSIKDCVELAQGLRQRGLKVACYHANLEPAQRTSIHAKWHERHYQAVVATVAFGLGIDKPDVRFVLHHSLSKSMESYYQESGRAGRDGRRAECVLMYRTQDMFRLSTMVFSSQGSLDHLYGMVGYCLDPSACRRELIAGHFDEAWDAEDCNEMCDTCLYKNSERTELALEKHCRNIYEIVEHASRNDTKMTAQKILDSWYGKGPAYLRVASVPVPNLSRSDAESVIAYLLCKGFLKEDFHFTSYTTISYIKVDPRSPLLNDKSFKIKMTLRSFDSIDVNEAAPSQLPKNVKINQNKLQESNKKRKRGDEEFHKKRKTAGSSNSDVITID